MKAIGTVLNPIGAVADKVGGTFGKILDPAATIGKKVGGTAGQLIDPAGTMRRSSELLAPESTTNTRGSLLT